MVTKEYKHAWYLRNKERISLAFKKRYVENPELFKQRKLKYRSKLPKKTCLDCPRKILLISTRCYSCSAKERQNHIPKEKMINSGTFKKGHKPSFETITKSAAARMGANNPAWKGGVTPENEKIRRSNRYLLWRKTVFERDAYTCQDCSQRGGILQADHIKPFAFFPELRFSIENGRTLCVACHRKTDTWGAGAWKFKNKEKVLA